MLIVVLAIWGSFAYRFFFPGGEVVIPDEFSENGVHAGDLNLDREVADLNLDYRDPFLGASARPVHKTESSVNGATTLTTTAPKPATDPLVFEWPSLQYQGMVKNRETEDGRVVLRVNGKSYLVSKGDSISELVLVEYWKDSALVALADERKVIWR